MDIKIVSERIMMGDIFFTRARHHNNTNHYFEYSISTALICHTFKSLVLLRVFQLLRMWEA